MGTLMVIEQARLSECEATIEKGMATFVEVGQALAEIRDKRLYRDTHKTFDLYVKDRWGHERRWAYQLIDAAGVIENVRNCAQKPANEAQARELAKAPPEKQAEAWVKASKNGKPTAANVKAAVEEVVEEDDEWDVEELEQEAEGPDITALAAPYRQAGRDLDRIKRDMKAIADDPAIGGHLVDKITRITTACKELKATIAQMEPTDLCGKCGGKGCRFCASTGFWTKAVCQSWAQVAK